jgi:hypothetical protein
MQRDSPLFADRGNKITTNQATTGTESLQFLFMVNCSLEEEYEQSTNAVSAMSQDSRTSTTASLGFSLKDLIRPCQHVGRNCQADLLGRF